MNLHKPVSKAILLKAFKHFTGNIEQRVPKLSAVKRQVRTRKIYYIRLLKQAGRIITFEVKCQHGTYVRTLCHNIGDYLGVGAHMYELRRIQSGSFTIRDALTLSKVEKLVEKEDMSFIKKPIEAVSKEKKVYVDEKAMKTIIQGTPLYIGGVGRHSAFKKGDTVVIIHKKELIAIGRAEIDSDCLRKEKHGMAIKTDLVLV